MNPTLVVGSDGRLRYTPDPLVLVDHRAPNRGAIVRQFSYPGNATRNKSHLWNLSGTWTPDDDNTFALGGVRNGIRMSDIIINSSLPMGYSRAIVAHCKRYGLRG